MIFITLIINHNHVMHLQKTQKKITQEQAVTPTNLLNLCVIMIILLLLISFLILKGIDISLRRALGLHMNKNQNMSDT